MRGGGAGLVPHDDGRVGARRGRAPGRRQREGVRERLPPSRGHAARRADGGGAAQDHLPVSRVDLWPRRLPARLSGRRSRLRRHRQVHPRPPRAAGGRGPRAHLRAVRSPRRRLHRRRRAPWRSGGAGVVRAGALRPHRHPVARVGRQLEARDGHVHGAVPHPLAPQGLDRAVLPVRSMDLRRLRPAPALHRHPQERDGRVRQARRGRLGPAAPRHHPVPAGAERGARASDRPRRAVAARAARRRSHAGRHVDLRCPKHRPPTRPTATS